VAYSSPFSWFLVVASTALLADGANTRRLHTDPEPSRNRSRTASP
jgi:hypothetical protein